MRSKRAALTALQLCVTCGVLVWLFHDGARRQEMARALSRADGAWILTGIAVYGLVELLAAWRWQGLLRVQGIVLARGRVFTLLLIGLFFNFFLPGGTGGDVVKIYYLIKEAPGRGAGAVLSVLMDRIIGLFALIFMSGVFIAIRWHWLTSTPATAHLVFVALLILGVSVLAIGFSFVVTAFGIVHRLPARFPCRDKLGELALGYGLFARAWRTSAQALGTSFVTHTGYFFTFYCAARAYAAPGVATPTFKQLCVIMPLVNAITAIPISIGGLGVRESLFQDFLNALVGVDKGVAILISSTGFLLTAVWGLAGGILYLLYRPSKGPSMAEISKEIAGIEHHVAEDEMELELSHEKSQR